MGRWRRHLDPSVERGNWKKEEDEQLRKAFETHGARWAFLARDIEGRTAQQCRARFYQLRQIEEEREEEEEKKKKKKRQTFSDEEEEKEEDGAKKDEEDEKKRKKRKTSGKENANTNSNNTRRGPDGRSPLPGSLYIDCFRRGSVDEKFRYLQDHHPPRQIVRHNHHNPRALRAW